MTKSMELIYYAKITAVHEGGYLVTFRDFDNVFTEGDTLEEALNYAKEALGGMLEQMQEDNDSIPLPSSAHKNEYAISV